MHELCPLHSENSYFTGEWQVKAKTLFQTQGSKKNQLCGHDSDAQSGQSIPWELHSFIQQEKKNKTEHYPEATEIETVRMKLKKKQILLSDICC